MNVSQLLVRLNLENRQFNSGIEQAKGGLRGLDTEAKGLKNTLQLAGIMGAAFMGKQLIGAVMDLGELGAQAQRVGTAFDELARQAGGSADEILAAIRRASGGTVADMDIMLAANKGILLGLGAQADQWEKLTEVARFRARAMGISVSQALGDISMGIGRESRLILDNLGIILDMDRVTADYAKTLGKTAGELSAFERKQAIVTSVIAEGQAQIQAAGGVADDAADKFEVLSASMVNLKTQWGALLALPTAEMAEQVGGMAANIAAVGRVLEAAAEGTITWGEAFAALGDFKITVSTEGIDEANAELDAFLAKATDPMTTAGKSMGAALTDIARAEEQYQIALAGGSEMAITLARANLEAAQATLDSASAVQFATVTYSQSASAAVANVSAHEQWKLAAHGSAAAVTAEGAATEASISAHEQWRVAAYGVSEAAAAAAIQVENLSGRMTAAEGSALRHANALHAVSQAIEKVNRDLSMVSVDEVGAGFAAGVSRIQSQLLSLAGVVDEAQLQSIFGRYNAELEELYRTGTSMSEFELAYRTEIIQGKLNEEVDAFRDAAADEKQVMEGMRGEYERQSAALRNIVTAALRPTDVTALDMALSEIGQYVDKWDENARRLDAIAVGGFAAIREHPDWAAILKIPEAVLGAGETALKDWARRTSDEVRNLFRPDLLNVEAAADAVEKYMREQAAREISIDLVIAAVQRRGGLSEAAARKQVLEAYGLEAAVPVSLELAAGAVTQLRESVGAIDVPVTLVQTVAPEGAEAAGMAIPGFDIQSLFDQLSVALEERGGELYETGSEIGQLLVGGLSDQVEVTGLGVRMVAAIKADLKESEGQLRNVGKVAWGAIENGFRLSMESSSLMEAFVMTLMPFIIRKLRSEDVWEGS